LQRKSQVTIRIYSAYLPQSSSFTKQILNGTARKDFEIYVHRLRCEVGIILQVSALDTILPYFQTPRLTFYVLLTLRLGIIIVNDQLDAQFFSLCVYLKPLYVSRIHALIIRRINCINTISGICHCM